MRFEPFFRRLRPWQLALAVGVLFVVDLIVPDPIPLVDELILGLVTLLLSRKARRHQT